MKIKELLRLEAPAPALGWRSFSRARRGRSVSGDASPHAPQRRGAHDRDDPPAITVDFRDVAVEAGRSAPHVSGGEGAQKYILETTGSGVGILDYDGDGLMDVFLPNASTRGRRPGRGADEPSLPQPGRARFQD